MSSLTETRLAQLAEDVRCDVHSRTQDADNDARRAEISRTFISDTVTVPTKEMNEYAIRATLGDDVFFEPSTAALESHVAKLTGKEAGLFMPTGTMSNQVALRTHLQQPPYSVLCDARAHVYRMEGGGIAFHSGANVIPVFPENGHHLTWEDIEPRIVSGADVHIAPTRIVSLESTLNGTVIPQEDVIAISRHAREKGIIMHLDGARLWHVAVATGLSMKELCEPFESVSLCFSKGLGKWRQEGQVIMDWVANCRRSHRLVLGGVERVHSQSEVFPQGLWGRHATDWIPCGVSCICTDAPLSTASSGACSGKAHAGGAGRDWSGHPEPCRDVHVVLRPECDRGGVPGGGRAGCTAAETDLPERVATDNAHPDGRRGGG